MKLKFSSIFLLLCSLGTGCTKEDQSMTITLHDKPLPVIQSYIKGKWKLQYVYGGPVAQKIIDTHNSYLILSPDHIIAGNDPNGIFTDTSIVWVKTKSGSNDSTYLLSFSWPGNPYPQYYLVDQIKNDTLIIREYYISDGYNYYYTKMIFPGNK